jgi:hypothetical protein
MVEPQYNRHLMDNNGKIIKHDVNDIQMTRISNLSGAVDDWPPIHDQSPMGRLAKPT